MGARGPAPKRVTERLGHLTKAQKASTTAVVISGVVKAPPLPKTVHQIARRWYNSLKASGQSHFFEPSDWSAALYVCEAMTKNLESPRFSAPLFMAVWSAMEDLLSTEQARRRSRLEVERGEQEEETGPTAIEQYRKALGQ